MSSSNLELLMELTHLIARTDMNVEAVGTMAMLAGRKFKVAGRKFKVQFVQCQMSCKSCGAGTWDLAGNGVMFITHHLIEQHESEVPLPEWLIGEVHAEETMRMLKGDKTEQPVAFRKSTRVTYLREWNRLADLVSVEGV